MSARRALVLSTAVAAAATGCFFPAPDGGGGDVDKFRQPIPTSDDVEVPGPETGGDGSTASFDGLVGTASEDDERWAKGPWAKYYAFTRLVRLEVNVVTAAVLGSAWLVVHTRPTSVDETEAIWGPYTDALSPVTWRFRVTEVGDREYEYVFEGRPKRSTSDDDYQPVLEGLGYGRSHPKHGDGHFQINMNASRELDPLLVEDDESGTIRFEHELSKPEKLIQVESRPSDSEAWWTVESRHHTDGGGELLVNAYDNLDDTPFTVLEDIQIASQWKPTGAGRADITLSGGDVPDGLVISAVECWDSDFFRVYYGDDSGHEATEGTRDSCEL